MYRSTDLLEELPGVIGWKQNYNTSTLSIADSLTSSSTGSYYQDYHPLLTLENIRSIAPDFEAITYNAWSELYYYTKGRKVTLNGVNYRALIANENDSPTSGSGAWEVWDAFSEWLEQKTNASLLKAIRTLWDKKMSEKRAKNVIESKSLFNGSGRITDLIVNADNLVGFELVNLRRNGVTLRIKKIGLQFSGPGAIRMYLMHSSRLEPVNVFTLSYTRTSGIQWFDVNDVLLPYVSDDNDAGGSWYLVYNQSELPEGVQAINKNKDWSKAPCVTCDRSDYASYISWSKHLEVHPFRISGVSVTYKSYSNDFSSDFGTQVVEMWDVATNLYQYDTNWGLNLQVSIECDLTDELIAQKASFQSLLGLQVAIDMLREFAYNPSFKIGRAQQNFTRQSILYELDGDSTSYKKTGLVHEYEVAMEAIDIDTTNLSKVCTPCHNKGVRYKSM